MYAPRFPRQFATAADDTFSFDYSRQYTEARQQMAEWLKDGKLKRRFQVVDGLEKAPETMPLLYRGGNTGKLCVHSPLSGLDADKCFY